MTSPDRFVTRDDLVHDLSALGIASGDHVALGASLRSLGSMESGADTLIDALLGVVGTAGTLLIPTYTPVQPLSRLRTPRVSGAPFDPASTKSYTGVLSEAIRARNGAIRSRHPTNSMAALGAGSKRLLGTHDETAPAYGPFRTLADMGGKVLSIGIGARVVGLQHQAQAEAGLLAVVPSKCGALYRDRTGTVRVFRRPDKGGCTQELPLLIRELHERGILQEGRLGQARVLVGHAQATLDTLTDALRRNPERNLCNQRSCAWCRQLELRLNLYDRISSPLWFQTPLVGRILVGAIRLRGG